MVSGWATRLWIPEFEGLHVGHDTGRRRAEAKGSRLRDGKVDVNGLE